ncbi:nucleolar MIF4G domain-containing protein 1 homolog [Ostrinia furnacalis]|uniref:nucleolar MIF4G domain-containing protein 1 homolog n=1 Tax=Ostrinia furnacalis TaxID=93504 RepID=UPI00103C62C9|nr:nucleolar MIF4G domain-containing protein 1 homolog [Ostrinia furnacalis]
MTKAKKNKANKSEMFTNTRKALRKQKRQQKKVHRQEHYLKKKNTDETPKYVAGRFVRRPPDAPETETNVKKKKKQNQPTPQDIISKERQKDLKEAEELKSQMEERRRKMLLQANEDEDKVIKKLEKQLGLNKCKNKKNFFSDDGLDYLLEICDRTTSEQIVAAEKHLANVEAESDFEEDLAVVTGKKVSSKNKQKKVKDSQSDIDEGSDDEGSGEELDGEYSDEEMDVDDDEDLSDEGSEGFSDDNDDDGMSDSEPEERETKSSKAKKDKQSLKNINSKAETEKNNKNKKLETVKSKGKERIIQEDDLSKVFSDDEVSHLSDDDDEMEGFSDDGPEDENDEKSKEKPDVWEDIYGRKRDKEGNIIKEEKGVYIPPHLRNKDSGSDKELAQLKRQIKSVLNKLAGTNLHWACTSIENLYASNSRNSVNTALTRLWLDATVGPSATPDRMVAEHAALVSVLHANVATEIGAHFLQELTTRFDEMMKTPQRVEDKTLDNLVSCLAYLYSFKIYHATLLYDIFTRLLEDLTEKNIDCVLVALRSVGGVLRKEEPLALKEFIHATQARVAKLNEKAADGSRIKFLLEVLMAVKNNNLTKIPGYEPTYAEQLKKTTRGIIRKGNYITPLNIRLEDLLKAEERGKWWVVGSAWEGSRVPETKPAVANLPTTDQKLLELARKQRMNTDVRRSIFCVIMSAEDYMDAFEKLQHLGLKGQQERETVHVLMACCLQEKTFNPYYAVLAQKLCDFDRKYQLSIQYSTWDKIKELENLPKHSMANLAQLLVHLIMGKGLALSVLKVIQFSDLNKQSVRFMRQILLAIIMNADFQASLEVFHRVSKPPKLHMFRESIRLFIQHFLIKNAGKKNNVLTEEEMATLKERAVEVDKILTMHESKLRF